MLNAGTRRFDLYDFFSVFIPGAATILGLFPLAPQNIPVPAGAVVGIVVIGGFVVGRGVHATALWLEEQAGATTHRQCFIEELQNPSRVSADLATEFYGGSLKAFDVKGLPAHRTDLDQSHEEQLRSLYTRARSYLHIDARGRSRTFQAVLDFYRSIWVSSAIVAGVYMLYALLLLLGAFAPGVAGVAQYQSYLGTLDLPPGIIFYGAVFVIGGAYGTFERVRSDYRQFYIEYLFSDFVVLQAESTNTVQSGNNSPSHRSP